MGPNDPFPQVADSPRPIRDTVIPSSSLSSGTTLETTPYVAAAGAGILVGLAVWLLSWQGAVFVSCFGLGAVLCLWATRQALARFDFAAAFSALRKK